MGRLAETLACDASNVTGLVDRLESRGLIVRQASPADRRVKVLALTPTGARLREQLHRRMAAPPNPFSDSPPPSNAPWSGFWSGCSSSLLPAQFD